jgi:hypothetical protein
MERVSQLLRLAYFKSIRFLFCFKIIASLNFYRQKLECKDLRSKQLFIPTQISHLLRKELDASHVEGALYTYFNFRVINPEQSKF